MPNPPHTLTPTHTPSGIQVHWGTTALPLNQLAKHVSPAATMHQVHGTTATLMSGPTEAPHTDALLTATPGLWLVVKTADCVPILLYQPSPTPMVAAIHAGWRGLQAGIISHTISLLCQHSNGPAYTITAFIGPHISAPHYQVESTFQQHFPPPHPHTCFQPSPHPNKINLHLQNITLHQLQQAGVPTASITSTTYCTYDQPHLFHSHRRSAAQAGRNLSLIRLIP